MSRFTAGLSPIWPSSVSSSTPADHQPRFEPEIAFLIGRDLSGAGVTAAHVLAATEGQARVLVSLSLAAAHCRSWEPRQAEEVTASQCLSGQEAGDDRLGFQRVPVFPAGTRARSGADRPDAEYPLHWLHWSGREPRLVALNHASRAQTFPRVDQIDLLYMDRVRHGPLPSGWADRRSVALRGGAARQAVPGITSRAWVSRQGRNRRPEARCRQAVYPIMCVQFYSDRDQPRSVRNGNGFDISDTTHPRLRGRFRAPRERAEE
jgi:hypothetical protein